MSPIRPLPLRGKQRFSQSRMDALGEAFEPVCMEVREALAVLLRTTVTFQRKGAMVQQPFRLFPTETEFRRFGASGEEALGVGIAVSLLYPMLDRLLGASNLGEFRIPGDHVFTRLEERLAGHLFGCFWTAASKIFSEPFHSSDVSIGATEMTLGMEYTFSMAGASGSVTWYVPVSLAATSPSVSSQSFSDILHQAPWQEDADVLFPQNSDPAVAISATQVSVSLRLSGGKITPRALATWKLGDLLPLNQSADALFDLWIQGLPKFHAQPGQYEQRKVAKIID